MRVVRTKADVLEASRSERAAGRSIAFVPTMGAFHDGHLALIRSARAGADVVVVSIFVNPLQFSRAEDLASYPRDESTDLAHAEAEGVDVVFAPAAAEMYPGGAATRVSVGRLGEIFEGAARPGHFDGVCTVVAQLFNLVAPDVALFGLKDAQQVAVIKRMIADLCFPVAIEVCATQRAEDGLALSSRNRLLDAGHRRKAAILFDALQAGESTWRSGAGAEATEAAMWQRLSEVDGIDPDYARVVDPDTFEEASPDHALAIVAARLGGVRLIDNLLLDPSS
jgi:pantoate--beta-alanine ligase